MLDWLRSQAFLRDSDVFDASLLRVFMCNDITEITFGAFVFALAIRPYAQACPFLQPDLHVDVS